MSEKNTKEDKKKRSGGGLIAAAALIALLGGGTAYGLGNGLIGTGSGSGQNGSETAAQQETGTEEIPDTVIIRIEETTVTVNGHECGDEAELKAYLEEIYSDDRIFVLEEKNAILGTYEWVEKTCSEMGISLKK